MAKEMTINEKKELAKVLFTKQKMTQKEVAEKVRVTEKTIGKWVAEGKWKELQQSMLHTRSEQLSTMFAELATINEEIKNNPTKRANKEQAYVRDTLTQNIKKLQIETGAEAIIETAERFCRFMRDIDNDEAIKINNWFDVFIRQEVLK